MIFEKGFRYLTEHGSETVQEYIGNTKYYVDVYESTQGPDDSYYDEKLVGTTIRTVYDIRNEIKRWN